MERNLCCFAYKKKLFCSVLCIVSIIATCSFGCAKCCSCSACDGLPFEQVKNIKSIFSNIILKDTADFSPVATSQATAPVVPPGVQTINATGSQLIQAPNGQVFMLPSNAYPVLHSGQDQSVTLQTIQRQGMNNEAYKET